MEQCIRLYELSDSMWVIKNSMEKCLKQGWRITHIESIKDAFLLTIFEREEETEKKETKNID